MMGLIFYYRLNGGYAQGTMLKESMLNEVYAQGGYAQGVRAQEGYVKEVGLC
ncbi:MAG: hypothetical protein RSC99_02785 [Clostridiales bacterium]